jgi:integral membrane sensor domain MASE1
LLLPSLFLFSGLMVTSVVLILGDRIGYLVWPLTYSSTALLEVIENRLMVDHGHLVNTLCPKAIW